MDLRQLCEDIGNVAVLLRKAGVALCLSLHAGSCSATTGRHAGSFIEVWHA